MQSRAQQMRRPDGTRGMISRDREDVPARPFVCACVCVCGSSLGFVPDILTLSIHRKLSMLMPHVNVHFHVCVDARTPAQWPVKCVHSTGVNGMRALFSHWRFPLCHCSCTVIGECICPGRFDLCDVRLFDLIWYLDASTSG